MMHISLSKARNDFSDLVNRVNYSGEKVIIEKHGKEIAAIVSMDDLQLLERLVEKIEDYVDIHDAGIALEEYERGEFVTLENLAADLGLMK